MQYKIRKTIAAILAVVLACSLAASCGKKEPADSMIASETYTEATVPALADDELTALIREILNDPEWDGDFASLTEAQRLMIQAKLAEMGYSVKVNENGIVYYDYTPTADRDEIAEIVSAVSPEKKWDGKFSSLSDAEKESVQTELKKRGYDVEIGDSKFEFKSKTDRKEETTRAEYNQLPTKEMLAAAIEAELGMEGYKNWDGSFLSLTADQRAHILKMLNDYGYNVAINDKGQMYIIHSPNNTLTFDSAYSAAAIGGTTAPPTTVVIQGAGSTETPDQKNNTDKNNDKGKDKAAEPVKTTVENNTGTQPSKVIGAAELKQTMLKTFGGSQSDRISHIIRTSDGGYAAAVISRSKDGDLEGADSKWKLYYGAIVRFDRDLNVLWKGMYGEANMEMGAYYHQVAQLDDGSFIAAGETVHTAADGVDGLLVKYSKNGEREWVKLVKGTRADSFECVCATQDGGFIVGGGSTSGNGDFDGLQDDCEKAVLIKFNAAGERQWIRSLSGGSGATHFTAITVTPKGAIYAACQAATTSHLQMDMATYAGLGSSDSIVFKLNADGELIAHRAIAGSGADSINCLAACSDGGVLVGGSFSQNSHDESVFKCQTNRGGTDAYLVRLDAYLKVEWVKTFGGTGNDEITGVAQTTDGFAAVGQSDSRDGSFTFLGAGKYDAFILSVSENGSDVQSYALNGSGNDRLFTVNASGKHIMAAGLTQSTDGLFAGKKPASNGQQIAVLATYEVQ